MGVMHTPMIERAHVSASVNFCSLRARVFVLCAVGVVASVGCSRETDRNHDAAAAGVRQYQDVSLEHLVRNPHGFDEAWVRVRGVADMQFEGTSLRQDPNSSEHARQAVWLHLGWPLPASVKALDANPIIVDARFDADERGHAGMFQGMLTDIRAIWRPGHEAEAYTPNYQTRSDALEQLEFKTAWVQLGFIDYSGQLKTADGSTVPVSVPRAGDRLRLSRRMRLHIVDYAKSGEARRMEAPIVQPAEDETRLWIAPGTLVQVDEVRVAPEPAQFVWARLSPIARASGGGARPEPPPPPPPPPSSAVPPR